MFRSPLHAISSSLPSILLFYILITYENRPPKFHTSIWQPPALTKCWILNAHKLLTSAAPPSLLGFQQTKNLLGTGTNPFRFSPSSSRPTHRPRFSSKQLEPREVVLTPKISHKTKHLNPTPSEFCCLSHAPSTTTRTECPHTSQLMSEIWDN